MKNFIFLFQLNSDYKIMQHPSFLLSLGFDFSTLAAPVTGAEVFGAAGLMLSMPSFFLLNTHQGSLIC